MPLHWRFASLTQTCSLLQNCQPRYFYLFTSIVYSLARSLAAKTSTSSRTARPAAGGGSSAHEVGELNAQLVEAKLTIEGLEKERDFYFGKLRDIEVLAQEHEVDGGEFVQKVLAVLYATEVSRSQPLAPWPLYRLRPRVP